MDTQNAPFGCVEFLLSRYQTLIAAAVAAIALFPVWRQVRLQGAQTDIAKSAALRRNVAAINALRVDLEKEIDRIRDRLQAYPDLVKSVNFWAHDAGLEIDSFLRFVSDQSSLRLDGKRAVAARADLIEKVKRLSSALWVINWDVYLTDEDSPSDKQQAEFQVEAEAAETNLETTIGAVIKSSRVMLQATLDDIADARIELRSLDAGLMSK